MSVEAAGKQIKCKCGKVIRIGQASNTRPGTGASQLSSSDPSQQLAGGELDFLSSVDLTNSRVVKGPSYLGQAEPSATESEPASKTTSLTGSFLASAAGEFSSSAEVAEKEKKRTRFLIICSSVFACIIIPPVIYLIYKAANATTEGYANWGDKVQADVISMKMQTADADNKTKDLSEITSKRSGEFPKQPTEGEELVITQKPGYKTQSEVRLQLETRYPGWKLKSLTFNNHLFREAMTYQPPAITLPEDGFFTVGNKDTAVEVMNGVSKDDNDAVLNLFLEQGFFACSMTIKQATRAPGKITLRCSVDKIRGSLPDSNFPSMVETVKKLVGNSFTTTLIVDDQFTTKEETTSESAVDESNIEVRSSYSEDPTMALRTELENYMKEQLRPKVFCPNKLQTFAAGCSARS
ncbi:hypothetical protein OAE63_00885 [bacterium]|nr:hypothetical protein [bacterium]